MARVAIVGGGVSGLSVGLYLSETHVTRDLNLTVFSDKFSPSTTSDRAGAIIRAMEGPSYYGGATNEDDTRWSHCYYTTMDMVDTASHSVGDVLLTLLR